MRRPNPGTLSDFAAPFADRIEDLDDSGDWWVWRIAHDRRGVERLVARQKALGYGSAWSRHGQVGVLKVQVD